MQLQNKSLGTALEVLKFFAAERPEWGVSELAEKVGLHKSQVSRILRTFEAYGFIRKDALSGGYRLGRAFLLFAGFIKTDEELCRLARPLMERLNRETEGTVFLKVCEGTETVTIDRVESQQHLRLTQPIGLRLPLNATSAGKVFLAYMDGEELKELWQGGSFIRFTPKTKTDLAKLEDELREIRRRGYAVSYDEYMLGTWGIAAPIFDGADRVQATLGLGMPNVLFPKERVESLARAAKRAAADISSLLKSKNGLNGKNHLRTYQTKRRMNHHEKR